MGGWSPPGAGTGRQGQLVGWWWRALATLVDDIVLIAAYAVLFLALKSAGQFLFVLISAAYSIALIGAPRAQTVGNIAASSRVVDAATGQPPGYGKAAVRWVVQEALAVTVIGGILDILWPLWDDKKQTVHDKAAGTVVVHTN